MAENVGLAKLDVRPTPADHRDYSLSPYMSGAQAKPASTGVKRWENPIRLNQGVEGACVGFGWTGFLNAKPRSHDFENAYAFSLYHECTRIDQFPGTWKSGQQGTDVRVGAKVLKARSLINAYAFAESVEAVAQWLLSRGPIVVGVPWYASQDDPQGPHGYAYVDESSGLRGFHCVALDAVAWTGSSEGSWFGFPQSWGPSWGNNGRGRFTEKGFEILLNTPGAVAVTAVERRVS